MGGEPQITFFYREYGNCNTIVYRGTKPKYKEERIMFESEEQERYILNLLIRHS